MAYKIYKIRTLTEGYKLGKHLAGRMMIGIPEKYYLSNSPVLYAGITIRPKEYPPLHIEQFPDKFGRGFYRIYFIEFKDEMRKQMRLFQ